MVLIIFDSVSVSVFSHFNGFYFLFCFYYFFWFYCPISISLVFSVWILGSFPPCSVNQLGFVLDCAQLCDREVRGSCAWPHALAEGHSLYGRCMSAGIARAPALEHECVGGRASFAKA